MNIIFLLLPLALILVAVVIWIFFWAIKSRQFDDMEGPAYRILMDDDAPGSKKKTGSPARDKRQSPDDPDS